MVGRAFIIGGTGQIGRAITTDLLAHGWEVVIAHRGHQTLSADLSNTRVSTILLDRDVPNALATALSGGADAVIDLVAYTPTHAEQLLALESNVGSFIVISSASVYRDSNGRTLDEARENGPPELPEPISEIQPTVEPGLSTYSTRKVAIEYMLLDQATHPVTILRPCAIHGVGSQRPREWWFVKRMLDARPAIPLAYSGTSRFHTTSVINIAALTRLCLEKPGSRVLNIADPTAPSVKEIGHLIARHLHYETGLLSM
ncbi:NAD-dependent epimerase/dehydratase family protein [Beijerinckia indica]|uniref:NAD-dependent epimerase/dehydratase family protein n=1 Tax=Beijerinckia indica TaxID=533 RepID=UPI0002D7A291|nr:NAD-dependent epimerase/dehydratase family protein [Beijerinckia indica]